MSPAFIQVLCALLRLKYSAEYDLNQVFLVCKLSLILSYRSLKMLEESLLLLLRWGETVAGSLRDAFFIPQNDIWVNMEQWLNDIDRTKPKDL